MVVYFIKYKSQKYERGVGGTICGAICGAITCRYKPYTRCIRHTYGIQTVRYVFYDFVFLRSAVRYDTVRYGNYCSAYRTVHTTGYTERNNLLAIRGQVRIIYTSSRSNLVLGKTQISRNRPDRIEEQPKDPRSLLDGHVFTGRDVQGLKAKVFISPWLLYGLKQPGVIH